MKTERSFNVIYVENNDIIPEIDDTDFLNFCMAFMKIQNRELKKINKLQIKTI